MRKDLRFFRFALSFRLYLRNDRRLLRLARSDFLRLCELGEPLLPIDLELQLLRFEVLLRDRDRRVLFDLVALLVALLSLLGESRETFGIERVVRIEELHRRLIDSRERHALELETVLEQILAHRVLHALDEILSLVHELLHRHGHRSGA